MRKHIVCNVSEQTIPTILFINEMSNLHQIDTIFFIITDYSKKMYERILNACPEIESKHKLIQLPGSDSIKDIRITLDAHFDDPQFSEAHFLVDITCGTKIMSISLYEYFKEFSSEIFYINIHKERYRKIYPGNQREEIAIGYKIPLKVYLKAYGTELKNPGKNEFDRKTLCEMFNWYQKSENWKVVSELRKMFNDTKKLKKPANKKNLYFPVGEVKDLQKVCRLAGFPTDLLNVHQIKFITGGWFEEYIFVHIKEIIKESRALNCNIVNQDTKVKNEFDVMFILSNRLYIIEAKTNFQGKQGLHNDTLYKSKALEKDFGLRSHSIIATLDRVFQNKQSFKDRAELMNIDLLFENDLQPENITASLSRILQLT